MKRERFLIPSPTPVQGLAPVSPDRKQFRHDERQPRFKWSQSATLSVSVQLKIADQHYVASPGAA